MSLSRTLKAATLIGASAVMTGSSNVSQVMAGEEPLPTDAEYTQMYKQKLNKMNLEYIDDLSTNLSFQFPPSLIREKARQGEFLSIGVHMDPLNLSDLDLANKSRSCDGEGFSYVAVVLDPSSEGAMGHYQNVYNKVLDVSHEMAPENGGFITDLVPVLYESAKGYTINGTSMNEGDILIFMNDNPPLTMDDGHFPDTPIEAGERIKEMFRKKFHLANYGFVTEMTCENLKVSSNSNGSETGSGDSAQENSPDIDYHM